MFTEKNKGFTIITNFGCDKNCSYCISREHPLLLSKITEIKKIDWKYLEECIVATSSPKVNISGGGDPFYNYMNNLEFYSRIQDICKRNEKLLDAHTRILPRNKELLKKFNKLAVTLEHNNEQGFTELSEWLPRFGELVKLRVIDVIDERITQRDCQTYINRLRKLDIEQITFRQMFGNKLATQNYLALKRAVPSDEGVLFLDDGEYHDYYFTTTNQLLSFFFGNSNKDRETWRKKYEALSQKCI